MNQNIDIQAITPIDPDAHDWLDHDQFKDLFEKFDPIYDLLTTSNLLKPALEAWTRQNLLSKLGGTPEVCADDKASETLLMDW